LLAAKPDFLDLFITIGRVGRSLGVHLLLASQRLEEGRLRGLDTYLSYRIGLKTFSVAESRIVLGAADAFELPTAPGNGYLKFDTTGLVRFKAAYVSGPVRESRVGAADLRWIDPQPFRLAGPQARPGVGQVSTGGQQPAVEPLVDGSDVTGSQTTGQTLLDVAVSRLTGAGVPAHEVWLPPLKEPPTLDLLLPSGSLRGVTDDAISVLASSFLQVPLGWLDKPFDQTRGLLTIDMSGAAGNVAIVGGPRSGKSTALRSLLCGLALTHTPAELQLYCLDFGGGSLGSLADLPHVGAVAGRLQPELVRRTVAMVNRILNRREQAFTAAGIGSLAEWRERVAARTVIGDEFGDVILVVDGWGALKEFFEPLEAQLTSLATRGLNYGVHVVVTAGRWPEIRAGLKDMIGSRVELRLGDPLDSEVNAKLAAGVPEGRPGRGLSRDRLHLLTAVPRIDGNPTSDGLAAATAELVRTVATRWTGPPAPRVKLLPAVVRSADLLADLDSALGYPLGLNEDLEPVLWNPQTDQHLLLFGEEQSGKSTVLRNLIRQISARQGLDGARFIVFDAQRRLLDMPYRPDQLIASATNGRDAAGVIGANVERLQNRLPPPGMSHDEIGRRGWWGSPADIYLIIDNYERLAGSAPLGALLPLLDHAADIALHLIIARQARGASRAAFEPIYAALKDVGTPALVLSGPESEGAFYGRTRITDRPAGRGVWVPRRGTETVVQAILDPQEW
jgi:S-DNA-T family DNA segregation ATPase FtsK/SpoIIIE